MLEVKTLNEDFRSDLLILRWFLNGPEEKVTFKLFDVRRNRGTRSGGLEKETS